MDEKQVIVECADQEYRLFCRQALRFISELGGPEALDRFEAFVHPVFETKRPMAPLEAARLIALSKIDEDLQIVRSTPDLM